MLTVSNMKVEIPASLYALLQQQALAAQQLKQQQKPQQQYPSVEPSIPCTIDNKSRPVFVDRLIETSASIVESIWPTQNASGSAKVLPIKVFISEILKRSKSSFCTLQLALIYIIRLRNQIAEQASHNASSFSATSDSEPIDASLFKIEASGSLSTRTAEVSSAKVPTCGRRVFLTALILASKYLQDRNYNNKAWSKISGLSVSEINANEFQFLGLIDYELFVGHAMFSNWTQLLMAKTQQIQITKQQQQHKQVSNGTFSRHVSSLETSCDIPTMASIVCMQQPANLRSPSTILSTASKHKLQSPAFQESPSLVSYPSPESVDYNVPSGSDCGLKRGRSYCDQEDLVVKRVCF